jgi:multiple sugar transport system ATP-binding protein
MVLEGFEAGGAVIGDAALLGIRPEHVAFAEAGGLPGRVDLVEHMGGESYVYVTLDSGDKLVVRRPGQTVLQQGSPVCATFAAGMAHLFRGTEGEAAFARATVRVAASQHS